MSCALLCPLKAVSIARWPSISRRNTKLDRALIDYLWCPELDPGLVALAVGFLVI